jgi:hypothetical protein
MQSCLPGEMVMMMNDVEMVMMMNDVEMVMMMNGDSHISTLINYGMIVETFV